MKVIIDRFEGDFAVVECEDLHCVNFPRELVPSAKEGDVVNITIDAAETANRKAKIDNLMDKVFKNK
ncbi:MAG: DUF3006 domain-containing protein [Oscillospiraceae bacterium]